MDINMLISDYTSWIKEEITTKNYGDVVELTTPFLDRFNDYMQIYVKQEADGSLTLSDDGYILNNLLDSGMTFKKGSKRYVHLHKIIKNHNLSLTGNEIISRTTANSFPRQKHMMVHAMLAIDDIHV